MPYAGRGAWRQLVRGARAAMASGEQRRPASLGLYQPALVGERRGIGVGWGLGGQTWWRLAVGAPGQAGPGRAASARPDARREPHPIALPHHQRRTSCRISAQAAGVVHMVMRQHQIADRLARIFFLRRLDRPVRLPVGGRRIEDDQVIAHLDNKTMRRTGGLMLHTGGELGKFETGHGLLVIGTVIRIN